MSELDSTVNFQQSIDMKSDAAVFAHLQSLVGSWESTAPTGRLLTVHYSLHAKASVLMEAWKLGPASDALTLYHLDGGTLMATHYCPLCNQPRLLLKPSRTADNYTFEFVSATNLPGLDVAHQHSFELRLLGPDLLWRSETYLERGVAQTEAVSYRRIGIDGSG
jgi:hypothetical protein